MSKSPRILLATAILIGLGFSMPLLFPYTRYIPELENVLGQRLHGKVTIGKMGFNYLPQPAFTLEQIRLERQEATTIGRIALPLSLRTLLKAGQEIDEARAQDITLSPRLALGLTHNLTPVQEGQIRLNKLVLNNATIALNQEALGPFDAQINFKKNGLIDHLALQSADGKATLQIQPTGPETFQLEFSARQWQLPYAHPVKFDSLQIAGRANLNSLQIHEVHASLYEGIITGSGRLDWLDDLTLTGRIHARSIKAEPLVRTFSPDTHLSGRLAGEGAFLYRAANLKTLFDAPRLQGHFILNEGMIHNVDLVAPLKSATPEQRLSGGQTNFNQLRGKISVRGDDVSLNELRLESGKFHAQGEASIRAGKLAGNIMASIASGSILVTDRLSLGGTLAAPLLQSRTPWRPTPSASSER